MPVFPLGKLIYLGIRQLSKPIAIRLRSSATKHPFVSRYICAPPAQFFHRLEVFIRFRLMGVKGKADYKPLTGERAVELGSEILGETFLYSIAAGYIVYEYWRSVKKEHMKEDVQNLHISELQAQTANLERQLAGLQQTLGVLRTELKVQLDTDTSKKSKPWWVW